MQDWLSHRVATTPDDTALVRAATGEAWSFADVDAMVDETAGSLAALGVTAGDRVGTVVPTSLAAVCLVYAAMRLGATLVPLSADSTAAELAGKLDTADLSTLVCAAETEALAREAVTAAAGDPTLASVDPVDAGGEGNPGSEARAAEGTAATDRGADAPVAPTTAGDAPAMRSLADTPSDEVSPATWEETDVLLLLFTSGTTGRPKAVRLTLGNVLASAMSSAFRLGVAPGDRWLVALSLHHAGGITPVLRGPLYGMTVVLREEFDAGGTADDVDRYDVTGISLVPTMLRRMLDSRGTLADSLRVILLGGAPAPPSLVERCRDYAIPVHPTYGMTEAASQIATATPREAYAAPETVGRPLFMTDVTVVDDELDPLPAGEVGELVVAGPTVTPGYHGDEAATRAAFCEHGLRTGDVGYADEGGRLYVLGRLDDQVVTGGENVVPAEVAETLRTHPDVADAAVVGLPDPEWGERVAALVVPSDGTTALTAAEVTGHCRSRLAGFKRPRTVAFAAEIPRTVSGTVDRDAVRAVLRDRGEDVPTGEARAAENDADAGDDDDDGGTPTDRGEDDEARRDDGEAETSADDADGATSTGAGDGEASDGADAGSEAADGSSHAGE